MDRPETRGEKVVGWALAILLCPLIWWLESQMSPATSVLVTVGIFVILGILVGVVALLAVVLGLSMLIGRFRR